MHRIAILLALVGCVGDGSDDIVGPFTGPRHRFVVDSFTLPMNNTLARQLGWDLDGNGTRDNVFGMVVGTLAGQDNTTKHAADMIAAGVIASTVEIQADDLLNDDRVGVWYYGADGDTPVPMGGTLVDGRFVSNRTSTSRATGTAMMRLPVFIDTDPSMIELVAMQIDLVSDGRGGYDAYVAGGFRPDEALAVALDGIVDLLEARPQEHRAFWWLVDDNQDGTVTRTELGASLVGSLLYPDIERELADRPTELVSAGFLVHLSPCEAGNCALGPIGATCFDRVLDGNETDVDCGGSCRQCRGDENCRVAADCQSGVCDGGICAAPSCTDGRLDGYESDVDCGGACEPCGPNQLCDFESDCASGICVSNAVCQ